MKKFLLTGLCIALCGGFALAQETDLNEAIKMYNEAAVALNAQEYAKALESAQKALEIAKVVEDEEAVSVKENIESLIPKIVFAEARQLVVDKDYEKAAPALLKAVEVANQYNDESTKQAAEDLIPQVAMAQANSLLSAEQYELAIEAYKKVLAINANDDVVYLRIGQAQSRLDNEAAAVAAFEKAAELGSQDAGKQLANLYLRKAAAANSAKKFDDALTNAQKTLEYDETNATAVKLLAVAAVQLKKWDIAIPNLEKVIPSEKNPDNMIYNLATAYEARGNKAKACENYKKIVGNATFKAYAEAKVKELCK